MTTRPPIIVKLKLPKHAVDEAARWMAAEVERAGYLEHDAAALAIWEGFGFNFAYFTEDFDKHGRSRRVRRLHPDVVKAFKRLTSKTAVSEKDDRAWRKRKSAAA
jgi:hypothetical protein